MPNAVKSAFICPWAADGMVLVSPVVPSHWKRLLMLSRKFFVVVEAGDNGFGGIMDENPLIAIAFVSGERV